MSHESHSSASSECSSPSSSSSAASSENCVVCEYGLDARGDQDRLQLLHSLFMCEHMRRLIAGPSNIDHIPFCNVYCERSPRLTAGPIRPHQLEQAEQLQQNTLDRAQTAAAVHIQHQTDHVVHAANTSESHASVASSYKTTYNDHHQHDASVNSLIISGSEHNY